GTRSSVAGTHFLTGCLRVWSGGTATAGTANASATGGSFSVPAGAQTSQPDAVEIVYASGLAFSKVMNAPTGTTPTLDLADEGKFAVGDYVILTNDYQKAVLIGPVVTVTAHTGGATPTAAHLTFTGLAAAIDTGLTNISW